MKKILLAAVLLLLAALVLTSCETTLPTGQGGDTDPDVISFEIAASSDVYYLGGESVTLFLDGTLPDGYSASGLAYYIADGDSDIAQLTPSGTLTFSGTGAVTVRARLGEVVSTNGITVYSLYPDEVINANIAQALSGTVYLGRTVDVGITPSTAACYSLDGAEGYAVINSDGHLEFTGIRATQSRLRVLCRDKKVYEGMYSMEGSAITSAILSSLAQDGYIGNVYKDVSSSELSGVTSLSLEGVGVGDISEYRSLSYFTALEVLDLSRAPLYDLSFISGFDRIKILTLNNCEKLTDTDGGLTLYNTLESLTALESLSLVGSASCLSRTTYNILTSMVNNGCFTLELVEGVTLNDENIYQFSETVFFGLAEYLAHVEKNGGKILPHGDFSHAILSFADETLDLQERYFMIDASNLSELHLHGGGKKVGSHVYSSGELSLYLYDYDIWAANAYHYLYKAAVEADILHLSVVFGSCSVTGANGTIFELDEGNVNDKGYGIYAGQSVNISVAEGAHLSVSGGNGAPGDKGEADGSNPDLAGTRKGGSRGWDGIYGIRASEINFLSGSISVWGGSGGKGGDGGDGSGVNIFNGGYNGGHAAYGGDGAAAIACYTHCISDSATVYLCGGMGGAGGSGGKGYLAGSDGNPGNPGNDGREVAIP